MAVDTTIDEAIDYDQNSYRQTRLAAVRQKAKEAVTAPVQAASGRALRWAWWTLIPSWGLTLLYINLHVFMRLVVPSLFCRLGDEWIPKQAKAIAGSLDESASFGAMIVETIVLIILDIVVIIAIIGLVAIFVYIYKWVSLLLDFSDFSDMVVL